MVSENNIMQQNEKLKTSANGKYRLSRSEKNSMSNEIQGKLKYFNLKILVLSEYVIHQSIVGRMGYRHQS